MEHSGSSSYRATHYRLEAARIRNFAEREPIGRVRTSLEKVADQFDDLAASVELTPNWALAVETISRQRGGG
jgi:hypothetical protein